MSTDWEQIKLVLAEAAARNSPAERAAYLDGACRGDDGLRAEVEKLLLAHDQAGAFLENPIVPPQHSTIVLSTSLIEKPGDQIGHYKLLQQIGEGGCGVVYMAEQQEPIRRRVALKVIKLGMDTKQVIARFEAERQALALMDHPNIAKVLDAGTTDTGRPFFVMELVRGIKITEYSDENHLSTKARLELFVQICHAIQHAHQKGIIHRDIKPSNILVTVNDGVPVPTVIDFGIAKAMGQQLTDKTVFTAFEQFIGTPAYMSPEQALMTSLDIDTRSDIYALGVLLYELLIGHTPFEQKDLLAAGLDEMRRIIREQEPVRPSTRLSTLDALEQSTLAKRRRAELPQLVHVVRGDLDWIVMKSLEKDRTRRYETADGLADDVLRHLSNEPVLARPPSRLYRFQKAIRRNQFVFAAASAVAAALVIGLGLSTWLFFKEQAAHARAVTAEKVQSELRQQAQAEAKKSEQVAQFLKDMLQGVGPSVALGRDTTMLREILDRTAERVGKGLNNQPEVEAELRSTLGDVYTALGQFKKAEEMHRAALTLRRALWGSMNTNVADSLDSLGCVLVGQNRISEAEPFILEALAIRTNLLGAEHRKVAASLCHVGDVLYLQGKLSETEQLYRQSLAMRRRLLGNEHLEVVESLYRLGCVLSDAGKPDEAETVAREALAIQERLLPEAERATLVASDPQGVLVWTLLAHGRLDEAETLIRQRLALHRKLLGAEHPKIISDLMLLDRVLLDKGELDAAEATAREGLAISRTTVGQDHTFTALCLQALGQALAKGGRLAEAEGDYTEELAIWRKLGDANASSASGRLAELLMKEGKLPEAEASYREALDLCRRLSPDALERRQWLASGLGGLLKQQGRLVEAEACFREALTNAAKVWPNDPAKWKWQVNNLVDVVQRQGKSNEVEQLRDEFLTAIELSQPLETTNRNRNSTTNAAP